MIIKIIKTLALAPVLILLVNCGAGVESGETRTPSRAELMLAAESDPDTEEFKTAKKDSHRFLEQATFGPSIFDMSYVAHKGEVAWIDEQLQLPPTFMSPTLHAFGDSRWGEYINVWLRNAITAEDQLRQRVAFALSEIFVISAADGLGDEQFGLASYYDVLIKHSFGNFRELMGEVTLHPIMGEYLSMKGNSKPDPEKNIRPDENYARELLQLFTIGLVQLNPDGSAKLAENGVPLPTFDQDIVEGFAHVFTGWQFANADDFQWPTKKDFINPMQAWEEYHDTGRKTLLDGFVLKPGNTARADLEAALDNIFAHPNVGPFISRQLIQRLVTSNPSPRYIEDVAAIFDSDQNGVRGSLGSVIKAILLHDEARYGHIKQPDTFGKLKEPMLRLTALWRAFRPQDLTAEYNYAWAQKDIGQAPMNSPSVFNFFSPSFSPPGEVRNRGLVSPEFEIHDETSIVKITNRLLANSLWSHNYVYESDYHRWALDITPEVEMAEQNPAKMLNHLDLLLLGGEMSRELRQTALSLMSNYTYDNASIEQVIETIFLIVSSPEAAVQI